MRRALTLTCALMTFACAREFAEPNVFVQPDLTGSVRIPLVGEAASGRSYALRNVTVEIGGAAMLTLASVGADGALTTPLPAGSYSLFMRPGFEVVELDASGAEHAIEARLVGANPLPFQLHAMQDATLKLAFEHAGEPLVFGAPAALRVTSAR